MPTKKKSKGDVSYEGCYGHQSKPLQVRAWILRLVRDNIEKDGKGLPRWTGNIWGHPGTAKTALSKEFVNQPIEFRGKMWDGFDVRAIPVAQIEEMGDIHGVPEDFILMRDKEGKEKWVIAKDSIIDSYKDLGFVLDTDNRAITKTCPPDWVPIEERPGILLFDDANRASVRILKGIMQLIQDYRTIGWEVPAGWTILCTGNPDRQTYLVTTVDDAIITRQRHITMVPDAQQWSVWAANAKVDPRGINFVLRYPEMMIGVRTNLRTLTEFFRCIERFKDIENHKEEVMIDGKSLIDEETLNSFLVFATRDMKMVVEPKDVLENVEKVLPEIEKLMTGGREARLDIVAVICDRLYAHLVQDDYKISPTHVKNFQAFVTFKTIPEDLRHSLMRRVAEHDNANLKAFLLGSKEIYQFVAESLRILK